MYVSKAIPWDKPSRFNGRDRHWFCALRLVRSFLDYAVRASRQRSNMAIAREERAMKVAATLFAEKIQGVELVWSADDKLEKIVVMSFPM